MQLLAHYTIADFATFKAAFDADAEDRGANSLNLLQLWHEDATSVWALYAVANPQRARDYLDGAAQVFNAQAGVSNVSLHFVKTV